MLLHLPMARVNSSFSSIPELGHPTCLNKASHRSGSSDTKRTSLVTFKRRRCTQPERYLDDMQYSPACQAPFGSHILLRGDWSPCLKEPLVRLSRLCLVGGYPGPNSIISRWIFSSQGRTATLQQLTGLNGSQITQLSSNWCNIDSNTPIHSF